MAALQPACVNSCVAKQQQKHVSKMLGKAIVLLVKSKDTCLNMNPKGQMDLEQQHPLLPLL